MNGLVFHQEQNTSNARDIDRRYYRNFRFQRHIHGNPELLYVIDGEIEVTVDECTETVSAGQMCMILPWQIHSFYTRERSRTVVLVVSHSYMDDFLNSMRGYYGKTQVFRPEPAIRELFMQYLFSGPFQTLISSPVFFWVCVTALRFSVPFFPARIPAVRLRCMICSTIFLRITGNR